MKLTAADMGKVKPVRYRHPHYTGKPSDIDWEAHPELNGLPAKDISDALKISTTAVYKAADRGDVKIKRVKNSRHFRI